MVKEQEQKACPFYINFVARKLLGKAIDNPMRIPYIKENLFMLKETVVEERGAEHNGVPFPLRAIIKLKEKMRLDKREDTPPYNAEEIALTVAAAIITKDAAIKDLNTSCLSDMLNIAIGLTRAHYYGLSLSREKRATVYKAKEHRVISAAWKQRAANLESYQDKLQQAA